MNNQTKETTPAVTEVALTTMPGDVSTTTSQTSVPKNTGEWTFDLESIHESLNAGTLADAAAAYAELGIPVHPLKAGEKVPATKNGVKDATTNPEQINTWWTKNPNYNIGLATGHLFDVLDVDIKDGSNGAETVNRLNELNHLAGAFAYAHTASGGGHYLFAPSGDGNHTGGKGIGLDTRGIGGYIVAAPSTTPVGDYLWVAVDANRYGKTFKWTAAINALNPQKVIAKAAIGRPKEAPRGSTKAINGILNKFAAAEEGNRNACLYWAAMRLHEHGADSEQLRPIAENIGLDTAEITKTLDSARKESGL